MSVRCADAESVPFQTLSFLGVQVEEDLPNNDTGPSTNGVLQLVDTVLAESISKYRWAQKTSSRRRICQTRKQMRKGVPSRPTSCAKPRSICAACSRSGWNPTTRKSVSTRTCAHRMQHVRLLAVLCVHCRFTRPSVYNQDGEMEVSDCIGGVDQVHRSLWPDQAVGFFEV